MTQFENHHQYHLVAKAIQILERHANSFAGSDGNLEPKKKGHRPRKVDESGEALLRTWIEEQSDATVAEPRYIDGGEYSVAIFQGRGTNDAAMGGLPGNGRRMDMPFCEIFRYDADGRVVSGEMFYDTATMLVQLGVMEPPPSS